MNIEDDIKKRAEETQKEVRWWSFAAWTMPFIALAGLFFFNILGWESAFDKALVIGAVTMFSIGVFWWWWAIHKIFNFADMLGKTADRMKVIAKEFSNIKKDMK